MAAAELPSHAADGDAASLDERAGAGPVRGFAVAWSGGRDSTALLHACLRPARATGLTVHAFHIDHGLQPPSADWARRCAARAARWARAGWPLVFASHRLNLQPRPGESLEALARAGRYAALAALARQAGLDLVLLAQHRRDQAETVLLQALRGAGPAGLAAMPRQRREDGITWARPWRDQPREAVEAYLRRHRLGWIEDPSNAHPVHARNRLRQAVWPALSAAFPAAEAALARLADHAAEAAELLAELAAAELVALGLPAGAPLPIAALQARRPARARLLLRHWLAGCRGGPVPAERFESLWTSLGAGCGPARWSWPGGELRRYRGSLHWIAGEGAAADGSGPAPTPGRTPCPRPGWHAPRLSSPPPSPSPSGLDAEPALPTGLHAEALPPDSPEPGLPPALLARLQARPRQGGERFQAGPGRPPRALKKQFQAAGLPPWARQAPLFYCDGQLVFVPGLGLDARVAVGPGTPRLRLVWRPQAVSGTEDGLA